jgi:hypothetical protein
MTPEKLIELNGMINDEFEQIIVDQENETKTENQLIAETYSRMIAVSMYGFDLMAMAASAQDAGDRIADILDAEPDQATEEEVV